MGLEIDTPGDVQEVLKSFSDEVRLFEPCPGTKRYIDPEDISGRTDRKIAAWSVFEEVGEIFVKGRSGRSLRGLVVRQRRLSQRSFLPER